MQANLITKVDCMLFQCKCTILFLIIHYKYYICYFYSTNGSVPFSIILFSKEKKNFVYFTWKSQWLLDQFHKILQEFSCPVLFDIQNSISSIAHTYSLFPDPASKQNLLCFFCTRNSYNKGHNLLTWLKSMSISQQRCILLFLTSVMHKGGYYSFLFLASNGICVEYNSY